jgi:hypothetical protein
MYQLSVDAALAHVRKAIDELISAEDIGLLMEPDALNLHKLVAGHMVEAVMNVYSIAPTLLLNGKKAEEGEEFTLSFNEGVATIQMNVPTAKVLALKCSDSEYILSDLIPENSAEGRKQLNEYARGTYDDPRLVLQQVWAGDFLPILKYYSIKDKDSEDVSFDIEYLPYPIMEGGIVEIPQRVEYAVLNTIVAHDLDSYKEFEIADRFRAKAKDSLAE